MPGATSVLAIPYPLGTDSVDVPGDIQALAERVDEAVQPYIVDQIDFRSAVGVASDVDIRRSAVGQLTVDGALRTTGELRGFGEDHRFGKSADLTTTGPHVHIGSFGASQYGYVSAETVGVTALGLILRGGGASGSVILEPNPGFGRMFVYDTHVDVTTTLNAQLISVSGGPTGSSPIYVNAPSGLTAQLVNLQKNGTTQFQIDNGGMVSVYNTGAEKIRLEPTQSRLLTYGDQSGIAGNSTDGTTRYLFGLRSDVSGNAADLVAYTYGGAFGWFVNGPKKMELTAAGALSVIGETSKFGPNVFGAAGALFTIDTSGAAYAGAQLVASRSTGAAAILNLVALGSSGNPGIYFSAGVSGAGTLMAAMTAASLSFYMPDIDLNQVATTTVAPAAGGAGALPATPAGYFTLRVAGTQRKIAYY